MPATDLARIGRALYGQQWQSALARDLGVSDRTMRRWVAGTHDPPDLRTELLAIVRHRRDDLTRLARLLS